MNIEDCKQANYLLKKIRRHQQKIAEFEKKRDAFIEEYQARIETAQRNCELDCADSVNAIADLKAKLSEIALNNLGEGEKTLRLPEGKLSFYSSPVEFYFDDGSKPSKNLPRLIEYLQHYDGEFVATTYSADWSKFKKALKYDLETGEVFNPDGEVIEGLNCLKPADKFKIVLADNEVGK